MATARPVGAQEPDGAAARGCARPLDVRMYMAKKNGVNMWAWWCEYVYSVAEWSIYGVASVPYDVCGVSGTVPAACRRLFNLSIPGVTSGSV